MKYIERYGSYTHETVSPSANLMSLHFIHGNRALRNIPHGQSASRVGIPSSVPVVEREHFYID